MTAVAERTGVTGPYDGFRHTLYRTPDAPAAVLGGRTYSYGELGDVSARWAERMVEICDGRPRRVGVLASRDVAAYQGILAALHAGATYVPLPHGDTRYLRDAVRRAELDLLVVPDDRAGDVSALAGLADRPPVLAPGACGPALRSRLDTPVLDGTGRASGPGVPPAPPPEIAYLMFTSGSTGRPKGVPVSTAGLRAFLEACRARYPLTPDDRLSQTFDLTFDLSVFGMFLAWGAGACLYAMDPVHALAPARFVDRHGLTLWFSVPSVVSLALVRDALGPGSMPSLRWSLFCGERLPRRLAESWQAAAPFSAVENLYGPTEATVACTAYRWDPARSPGECLDGVVPIGEPFPGCATAVTGADGAPLRGDGTGELWLSGPQLAAGYWREPELTALRFVDRSDVDVPGTYYRTGDVVRRTGRRLSFLGRTDDQVKVNGWRVELGAVEAALRESGAVEAVAHVRTEPATGHDTIVAAVRGADPDEVGVVVRTLLPEYQCPRRIRRLDAFPLNRNGKIDRPAVRAMLESEVPG